ncbi:MAG: GxGYxYP family putative glycoside hydrolase [Armatimonadota bacterium]|nr:GxGYxYP family putative glycoside hydrolase [Armatimonadota bacterium]
MVTRIGLLLVVAVALLLPQMVSAASPSDIVAKRRALAAEKPYASMAPRSKEPTGKLTVLKIWPDDLNFRLAIGALQGIVNREQPRIYIGIDKTMSWMEYYSGKVWIEVEDDPYKIFEEYKSYVKGMVVYDLAVPGVANVAVTYAGLEDLIPVTAELAEEFSAKYGWKVVHDLRGRWKDRLEAHQWAFENLLPRCNKFALMHKHFGSRPVKTDHFDFEGWAANKTGMSTDYAVEFRMFVWHIGKDPVPGELELAGKILESFPFYTPVFGRCGGGSMLAEPPFVCFIAKYADVLVPFGGAANVSVLSGVRVPEKLLKQKPLPVRDLGPDKIYLAFVNSEHDNLEHVIAGGPPWHRLGFETDDPYRIWWCDPWRGRVPIGWAMGPLLSELAPTTLAQLMTTATENDYFMAALSGMGLTSLPDFATVYPEDQEEIMAGYGQLTSRYLKRLGWTMVNPMGGPGSLRTFVKNTPGLEGALEGYGRRPGMTPEKASYLLEGVPIFHSRTGGLTGTDRSRPLAEDYQRKAEALAKQIIEVNAGERPAFIHAWTVGWDFGPTILKMAADMLPSEYAVVRPDELAALFKKYRGSRELRSTSPRVKASGVVTETPAGDDGLVVDTGKVKMEIGWGKQPQPPIRRIMGVDGKWRGVGKLPGGSAEVTSFSCERITATDKEKEYLLTYAYDKGGHIKIKVRAIAGRPFVIYEETSDRADLPAWTLELYPDFQPDVLICNSATKPLTYKGLEGLGSLPNHSWAVARSKGSRDLIGLFTLSWGDWNSGEIRFLCGEATAWFEADHTRAGIKRFAVAALDANDAGAPERIWKELNAVGGK